MTDEEARDEKLSELSILQQSLLEEKAKAGHPEWTALRPEVEGETTGSRGWIRVEEALPAIDALRAQGHRVLLVYLDAPQDVLVRRFEGTRRRHPILQRQVSEAITDDVGPRGWVNPTLLGGGEMGDLAVYEVYVADGHEVQYEWSNAIVGAAHSPSTGARGMLSGLNASVLPLVSV